MSRLTVRAKLTLAFGAFAFIVLIMAVMGFITLADGNRRFEHYVNGINARSEAAHAVRAAVDLRAIAARNLVLETQADALAEEKATVQKAHADVATHLARLKQLAEAADVPAEARRLIAEIDRVERAYGPVAQDIVDLALQGKHDEAVYKMNHECRPLLASLIRLTDDYAKLTSTRAAQEIEVTEENFADQKVWLLFASLLAFAVAVAAGVLITRSLGRSLGADPAELCLAVNRVADGDFTAQLPVRHNDSESVLAAVARMQASLSHVVATVRQGAESVSTGAAQIAGGNNDLSSRTETQASTLEETAASMEELGSTVQQNAHNARQANQLAKDASTVATQGGAVVAQVVDTMKGINESSRKIADIIGVIDSIAFQTNILALNAAVEAARAGEQGRGFAVVASEVRSLASRSGEAARQIKTLISDSVERVEQGSILVDQAGETMDKVVASIRKVTDIMGEISSASAEQSQGVSQVAEAVSSMDQTTQQNAAMVEEMAAAASSLHQQADDLLRVVAVFKVAQSQSALAFAHSQERVRAAADQALISSGAALEYSPA